MTLIKKPIRVDIWHNILWSRYKGEIFSCLYALNDKAEYDIRFFQIAETSDDRVGISGIDLRYHRYPHTLLFKGSYGSIGRAKMLTALFRHTVKSDAEFVLLAGYGRAEFWMQLLLLTLKGRKIGVFCDSTIYDQKQRFLRGLLKSAFFKSVNALFCYGIRSKEYVTHYGARPSNAYDGCQAAALPPDYSTESALAMRAAMAPSVSAPRYLYVGRLSHEKALDVLIEAFAEIWKQNSAATLTLVGSGPEREALERQALRLKLSQAVIFSGSKSGADLFQEYSKATCLMLPSRSEPWGLVVNEALSYGCPAIVSRRCGCVPELIIEGLTGFSHEAEDVVDMAEKMKAAPERFSDISATASQCIQLISQYSPDAAAAHILNGIKETLASNRRVP